MGPKKAKLPIDRPGIIADNPEKFYTFGDEIGQGKFAITKHCTHKVDGSKWAAKIIKFDSDSLKFAIREYDFMTNPNLAMDHRGLVKLHEAYLVRKYLILIMECADGMTLLDYVANRHSLTEDAVANLIKQLCEVLEHMHSSNALHLDVRPTNIRMDSKNTLRLVDYNSGRFVSNKKAGAVVDVIGDTEFCAPELLCFDNVVAGSDMWSVAVCTYILLSGISPFFYEDEDEVLKSVQTVKWNFVDEMAGITSAAKDFIRKCFVRIPDQRLTAAAALNHEWLSDDYEQARKNSSLDIKLDLQATDERLYSEEEEDYVWASLVFRTFDEDEYDSPESEEEDDD